MVERASYRPSSGDEFLTLNVFAPVTIRPTVTGVWMQLWYVHGAMCSRPISHKSIGLSGLA